MIDEMLVVMSGIRPDRSKGGRYKLAQAVVNGDVVSRPAVSSSHVTHSSTGKCRWSLNCFSYGVLILLMILLHLICLSSWSHFISTVCTVIGHSHGELVA